MKELTYIPPFTVTEEVASLVADIAEMVGRLTVMSDHLPTPRLRKANRGTSTRLLCRYCSK